MSSKTEESLYLILHVLDLVNSFFSSTVASCFYFCSQSEKLAHLQPQCMNTCRSVSNQKKGFSFSQSDHVVLLNPSAGGLVFFHTRVYFLMNIRPRGIMQSCPNVNEKAPSIIFFC